MVSNIDAVTARVQEIESRLGLLGEPAAEPQAAPPAVTQPPLASGSGVNPPAANRPFDIALAQATGGVSLKPLAAGQFAPYIEGLITKYAAQNGLAPELVRAVIRQESDGNARDVSRKGAMGLMQLMPDEVSSLGVTDPFDPEQNIAAGTRLLSGLMRKYGGDTARALAAYNAGSGAVKKYDGVPPFPETQHYVQRIMGMLGKGQE
jgi:soluble lytic murein transglycosylase-like protein